MVNFDLSPEQALDRLEAVKQTSQYVDDPHLVVHVNGEPLDQLLVRLAKKDDFRGLVTTLTDWLPDPDEQAVAWSRILPSEGQTAIAPILVCPDDLDFYCTVVVVEVSRHAEIVSWRRFGIDLTDPPHAETIGSNVQWIAGDRAWQFDLQRYRHFLQACRALATD